MSKKNFIITGINGQLGQFLAKYLLENQPDINIIGTIRHKSYDNQPYIFDTKKITFELMDLCDVHSIDNLIAKYKPAYMVNSAANAFVGESWAVPVQHLEQNAIGVLHQLEAIRKHSPNTRYFNMGTSEEFGNDLNDGKLQDEKTKIDPKSPYGCSKAAARYLINIYRKSYGLYAIQNWTYNFESELRGDKYITKKITKGVARICLDLKRNRDFTPIEVGNINSYRSWQFCGDVADSIWRCLNQELYNKGLADYLTIKSENGKTRINEESFLSSKIKEYVVSSPECHSIRELIEVSFKEAGIDGEWNNDGSGNPLYEIYRTKDKKHTLVSINKKYFRPSDVTFLNGDSSLIQKELGFKSTLSFKELIKRMVDWDFKELS